MNNIKSIWRRIAQVVFYTYVVAGIVTCLVLLIKGGDTAIIGLIAVVVFLISASGYGAYLEMIDNIAEIEMNIFRIKGNTEDISEKATQIADDSGQIKKTILSMQNIKRE